MRTIRVHTSQHLAPGREVALPEAAAAHVVRVLRLRAGDPLVLFNGDGNDYESELTAAGPRETRARLLSMSPVINESPLHMTLAQAIARGEKMDWIVQKATELGVVRIVPLLTVRNEVKLDATLADKRVAHWRSVSISACEQCGRARLPEIVAPQTIDAWIAALDQGDCGSRLALLPDGELSPRASGATGSDVVLAVGPEGGFCERDVAALRAGGFRGLRLGPRVLRTETAGIAAIAAFQTLRGDF